ncbi:ferritin-like domain-containing protein [Actinomycetospora cinnamomea]|uniref:Uncharacterized protein n=1 Tax=Actinomycetospora cinnamomea TaxID=663609 RepID=A0A2U1FD02_9PSEU|nr:ferritin-like domain-containing protein [Actinomycetospora cinnamomea]PVZ10083.1 hypothetical protein C8D89_105159 [Actinomycetospora cinnamomea]
MTAPAPADVPILQTASSLVVLTADTYTSLRALPYGGGATALAPVRDLLVAAVDALDRARADLADATRAAGGRVQTEPDPRYAPVVEQALPTVRGPGDVVGLALTLEDVLAQTLVADVVDLSAPGVRRTVAGHAAASAQRKALLLTLQTLLSTGRAELAAVPPDLLALPPAAGTVGFPDVLFPTEKASPATEGAVR